MPSAASPQSAVLSVGTRLGAFTREFFPIADPTNSQDLFLADNPERMLAFLDRGLEAFATDAFPDGAELTVIRCEQNWLQRAATRLGETSSFDGVRLYRIRLKDGMIRPQFGDVVPVTMERFTDGETVARLDVAASFRKPIGSFSPSQEFADYLSYLGVVMGRKGLVTAMPMPEAYVSRHLEWIAAHPHSPLIFPPMAFVRGSEIDNPTYLMYAEDGVHIVALGTLETHVHDAWAEHAEGRARGGRPLTEVCAAMAFVARRAPTMYFHERPAHPGGSLAGSEMMDRAAAAIDLSTLAFAAVPYVGVSGPIIEVMSDIARALYSYGRLRTTEAGRAVRPTYSSLDMGRQLLGGLQDLARERLVSPDVSRELASA